MKAVVITTSGDPQVLQVQEVENPEIGDDEVLIRVDAAAINRADTLQRKGLHPSSKAAVPTRVSNVLESSKLLEKPSFDGRLAISGCSSWASSSCPIWCFSEGCCWYSRGCMSCLVNCFNDEPTVCRRNIPAAGLRNRSLENKAVIVSEAEKNVWPAITGVQVFSIDGSSRG